MSVRDRTNPPIVLAAGAGSLVVLGLMAGFFAAMNTASTEVWIGLGVAIALSLISLPLLVLVFRREHDPWIRVIIGVGLAAKILGSLIRYYVAFFVYGGGADAARYMQAGEEYAARFAAGDLSPLGDGRFVGTPALEYLSGIVVTLVGPGLIGGFLVFAWLSFWGLYGFYRAFRIGVPDGDARRYALLVFLLPSLVFWPSSIGKEAWIIACLGLAAYGAAKMLTRSGGYVSALAGGLGVALIRPHIALLLFGALAAGYLHRTRGARPPLFGPVAQAIGVVALLGVMFVGLQQVEEFFGVEEDTEGLADTTEQILDFTADRTAVGGSAFDAAPMSTPLEFPRAFVTVLFRPWPTEAENTQMLLTSVESLVLLGLLLFSWRRVRASVRQAWRTPYIRMALVYTVGFIVAYAAIANFGILARQRAQLYPFFLVLLSVLPHTRRGYREPVEEESQGVRAPGHGEVVRPWTTPPNAGMRATIPAAAPPDSVRNRWQAWDQ